MTDASRDRLAISLVIAATVLLGKINGALGQEPVSATIEPATFESNEGFFQLQWEAQEPIRLVEAMDTSFTESKVIYSGSDSGHVVSGKPDGIWYYRLEAADGARILSGTATITVRHHSLLRAFSFFVLGAAVFFATLGLVLTVNTEANERVR